MNKTIDVLLNRYSLRNFKEDKVEENVVNQILEAGMCAASAGNLQPVSIIKIEDKDNAKWFVDNDMQGFIGKAPLNLLFCLDFNRLKKWSEHNKAPFVMEKSLRHFWVGFQDVIIMAQSIETAGSSLGVDSVYIGTTVDKIPQIQEKFGLPKGVIPIVLLTIGYPKTERKIARKLSTDCIVHNEKYVDHDEETLEKMYFEKYGPLQTNLTDELKERILQVVLEVDGEDRVKEVKEHLDSLDKVTMPMRYFGLHYVANWMARENTSLLDVLYDNGFIWAKGENHPK